MHFVRRRGVVDRVLAFQPGGPCSISGGVLNFNFYPGTECVSHVCVVYGSGPDFLLTTDFRKIRPCVSNVMVHSLCFPYRHLTQGLCVKVLHWGKVKNRR